MEEKDIRYWMTTAYEYALQSPDLSTQNGAVVIAKDGRNFTELGWGCNTFPRGVTVSDARLARPAKYQWTEHAERSALFRVKHHPYGPRIMVCPWSACAECARAIILCDISTLVRHGDAIRHGRDTAWVESIAVADEMLKEAGVEIIEWDGEIGGIEIRHCGELWRP